MNDFRAMTDQQLHQKMLRTSQCERALNARIISLIEEASRRKHYLDLGFGTLFDYLTLGLSYSAAAAQRRISAARIAKEIPDVKERVLDGSLTLSNLSHAERFFRNESKNDHPLNTEDKKLVLKQLENKSSRDAEKTLLQLSTAPQLLQPEKLKQVTPEFTQVTFNADAVFMELLREARGLLASRMPRGSTAEVLKEMMKLGIVLMKKKKYKVPLPKSLEEIQVRSQSGRVRQAESETQVREQEQVRGQWGDEVQGTSENLHAKASQAKTQTQVTSDDGSSSEPTAEVQRAVYLRDQERCSAIDPRTGKRCGSSWDLELDHWPIPKGMGGPSTVDNLRLVCGSCNGLHAVEKYGREFMLKKMG